MPRRIIAGKLQPKRNNIRAIFAKFWKGEIGTSDKYFTQEVVYRNT